MQFPWGRGEGLWRGSLLPLDCEAIPKAAASHPSGSKLPRHGDRGILRWWRNAGQPVMRGFHVLRAYLWRGDESPRHTVTLSQINRCHPANFICRTGNSTRNVVPTPTSLRTVISPLCFFTMP
ncbi:hypothetical protein CGA22_23595 [Pseudomonas sp. PSB18]|nr:hypothetical protein [Pseudomonas sp. PSB18]